MWRVILFCSLISFNLFAEVEIDNGNYKLLSTMSSKNCPLKMTVTSELGKINFTPTNENEIFESFDNYNTGVIKNDFEDNICFFKDSYATEVWIIKYYDFNYCDSTNPLERSFVKKMFYQSNYFFIESLDQRDYFLYTCHYSSI